MPHKNGDGPPSALPEEDLRQAGLRYTTDAQPGIRRRRAGRGFTYTAPDGTTVRDAATLKRIRSLVLPPAWTDVWISPITNGHIQAIGRDSKNRRQYRYHSRWREVRDENKYGRALEFAAALPAIRTAVDKDLVLPGITRRKVLATVVRLLDTALIRVGNTEYARQNQSFGLTTLRTRHVELSGSTVRLSFRGKSGKDYDLKVQDRRVARVIRRCLDIPGYELFQYLDDDGNRASIDSSDVNEYLREISGSDFTAKDFRTWAGTVLAARYLLNAGAAEDDAQTRVNVTAAVQDVAARLGNTSAVARSCYIHPLVIVAYSSGDLLTAASTHRAGDEEDFDESLVCAVLRGVTNGAQAA